MRQRPSASVGLRDFGAAWHDESNALRISVRDAGRDANGDAFNVVVVLRNIGTEPIAIYQRWNSWGAYQWRFAIVDAKGNGMFAGNPEEGWTRNAPSAVSIKPGTELALNAIVQEKRTSTIPKGKEVFMSKVPLAFPLRVRAIFEATADLPPEPRVSLDGTTTVSSSALWVGAIATGWIDVR